jgi:hypothetical protein
MTFGLMGVLSFVNAVENLSALEDLSESPISVDSFDSTVFVSTVMG